MDNNLKIIHFVIADGHPIFCDSLRMLLEAEPGFCVVGKAADDAGAVRLVRQLKPDILLLELAMPRCAGMSALRDLASSPTPLLIIVLAAEIDNAQIVEALELGARAVVSKGCGTQELIRSIHGVMAGQYWVEHKGVADLAQALLAVRSSTRLDSQRNGFGLTPRELEVVELIGAAYVNRDIADAFSITESTVKRHLTHIFDKLGVSNRVELVLFATHHRLVDRS